MLPLSDDGKMDEQDFRIPISIQIFTLDATIFHKHNFLARVLHSVLNLVPKVLDAEFPTQSQNSFPFFFFLVPTSCHKVNPLLPNLP